MADRPIIFSAPMVRALLDGRKTQTRRVLKPPYGTLEYLGGGAWKPICTKFFRGDRLYVRETHSLHDAFGQDRDDGMRWGPWPGLASSINPERTRIAYYREGFDRSGPPRWRSPIHMPRWASRLTLHVTDVRVQRLQEISEDDALAEGIEALRSGRGYYDPTMSHGAVRAGHYFTYAKTAFEALWNSIHGPDAWDANPWVAAITFGVKRGNIDTPSNPDEVA